MPIRGIDLQDDAGAEGGELRRQNLTGRCELGRGFLQKDQKTNNLGSRCVKTQVCHCLQNANKLSGQPRPRRIVGREILSMCGVWALKCSKRLPKHWNSATPVPLINLAPVESSELDRAASVTRLKSLLAPRPGQRRADVNVTRMGSLPASAP